jgi:hypothetical protein
VKGGLHRASEDFVMEEYMMARRRPMTPYATKTHLRHTRRTGSTHNKTPNMGVLVRFQITQLRKHAAVRLQVLDTEPRRESASSLRHVSDGVVP